MANTKVFKKEELINWMTEIKKNFTFTQKVKFLREFWENKDIIAQLKEEREDWKTAWKEVQQQAKEDIAKLNQKITEKDDKIAGLYKLFQGTANIFNKQHNYVDQLKKQLEKEAQEKGTTQEQAQHLQEDIKRLDGEKSELETVIQQLQEAETKTKEERDQELQQEKEKVITLTQQVNNLTTQLNDKTKTENEVDVLLGKNSTETGLLAKATRITAGFDAFILATSKISASDEKGINEIIADLQKFNSSGSNFRPVVDLAYFLYEYRNYKFDRPNISLALWNNDYSKRPTQAQYQSAITQLSTANSNLSSWTTTFSKEDASQVQIRINNLNNQNTSLNSQIAQKNTQIIALTSQVSSWQVSYNAAQTNYNNVNNKLKNQMQRSKEEKEAMLRIYNNRWLKWDMWLALGIVDIRYIDFLKSKPESFWSSSSPAKELSISSINKYVRDYYLGGTIFSLDKKISLSDVTRSVINFAKAAGANFD
jgi:chromosome segregation ATPase